MPAMFLTYRTQFYIELHYHIAIDTKGCIAYSEKCLISTVGIENIIIVETDDAILVCDKNRTQDVKLIVERLQADGRNELLYMDEKFCCNEERRTI